MRLPRKTIHQFILMLAVFVVSASFYFEYVIGLRPCSLCLMQRGCVLAILLTTLVGLLRSKLLSKSGFLWIQMSWVLLGLFFSSRQLWLQFHPSMQGVCMPGLDVLIAYFSWADVLKALLLGETDCGSVRYHLLGLSLATWTWFYFISMGLLFGLLWMKGKRAKV